MRRSFATVLVGSNVLFREGLARILNAERFQIVGCAAALDEALLALLAQHRSILLIIGAGASDDPGATRRQIELFKERRPAGRVAILADHSHLSDVVAAFRAGANAYFGEISNPHAFIKALELVMLGQMLLPPEILPFILDHGGGATAHDADAEAPMEAENGDVPHLSSQEKRILRCLIEGDANKVIARKMNIAEATVKVHVKAILRKIRVQNRTQAAVWAANNASHVSTANGSDDLTTMTDVPDPLSVFDVVPGTSNSD